MTSEEISSIEARWKSDVDLKLDRMIRFADAYEAYLKLCLEREIDRKLIRRAVIEKSLAGALWVILGLTCVAVWDYIRHSLK